MKIIGAVYTQLSAIRAMMVMVKPIVTLWIYGDGSRAGTDPYFLLESGGRLLLEGS